MKTILIAILASILSGSAFAQIIQDPTSWTFEIKKKDAKHYSLIFHTAIKPSWHLYAMQPGGDGSLIGTSFTFDKAAGVNKTGNVKATTKAKRLTMEGTDGPVNLYTDKADFVQEVTGTAGNTITGTIKYQACNDQLCLPPMKKSFSFTLL